MSDTPRTDKEFFTYDTHTGDESEQVVPADFARKLEQDRAMLRIALKELVFALHHESNNIEQECTRAMDALEQTQ